MQALVIPERLQAPQYTQWPTPIPQHQQALVRLQAAALNHRDLWIQKGQYAGLRYPIIVGSDGVGIVEAVADHHHQHWVGKEVILNPSLQWGTDARAQGPNYRILGLPDHGTFAQFITLDVSQLHPLPRHLNWQQAAAVPLAALTAYRALFVRAALQPTDTVLITGIGGGVALWALQMAHAIGAKVLVTSGHDSKLQRAQQHGAAAGVNYHQPDWHKQLQQLQPSGFDVIIDSAGGPQFQLLTDVAAPAARIAIFGGTQGNITLSPQRLFWKQLNILGSTMGSADDFANMLSFISQHHLTPIIDSNYPLADGAAAFEHLNSGNQFGKVTLTINH